MFAQPKDHNVFFRAIEKSCQNGDDVRDLRKLFYMYAQEVQESLQKLSATITTENLKMFFSDYQRFTAGLWITT